MSIGRQKHQTIALADILVDQDQIKTHRTSQVHSLDRMHIHIDMPDTRYLPAQRSDGLPRTCSVAPQTTAAYQDMTPYSTVSSFNFPATADPTLLTPVSNAASPPMHQRPKELMRAFQHSQPSGNAQQPTPPNTSTGVYYHTSYDLSSSSQSPSPLTVHRHGSDFTMTPYTRHSSNDMNGHPSPKDDVPPLSHPYLGHYTVSGNPSDPEVTPSFRGDYPVFDPVDPSVFRGQGSPLSYSQTQHMMMSGSVPTPILANPSPLLYRPPRPGDIEDLSGPGMVSTGHPGQTYQPRPVPTPTRSRGPARRQNTQRPKKRQLAQQSLPRISSLDRELDADSLPETEEVVVLSDKCEEDARFIYDKRLELIKAGMKGKGMWEEISRLYETQHNGAKLEKATLQMRLTRAFAKHAIWPQKELERLEQAFRHIEQKRYKLILEHMKEIGGAKCWNWTPQLIEAKLIDLGLEEPNIDEKTNTRKRRRLARRRKALAQQNLALLHGHENWTSGLGLHPGSMQAPLQHHHDNEEQDDMMPNYTEAQRDRYIEQVVSKVKADPDDSSSEPDVMDMQYHPNEENTDQSQQNTRVAKQAVEHLSMLSRMGM